MSLTRVRHLAAFVSGGSAAILLALISVATALAGGDGTHFP
jgi:hypothetical protein